MLGGVPTNAKREMAAVCCGDSENSTTRGQAMQALENKDHALLPRTRAGGNEMTDEPKTCKSCNAWESARPWYDGICAGRCRKLDKIIDSDEPACEHYEEFNED
jgi:hypothetical protein